jgi:hypothetical protein
LPGFPARNKKGEVSILLMMLLSSEGFRWDKYFDQYRRRRTFGYMASQECWKKKVKNHIEYISDKFYLSDYGLITE